MKEKTACIIGIMFAGALIALTFLEKLPIEAFLPFAGAAIAWLYKAVETMVTRRRNAKG